MDVLAGQTSSASPPGTVSGAELPAVQPAGHGAGLPLSYAQERLWLLEQRGGAGPRYPIPWRLRLRGELDREALGHALERIVARHDVLRTTFHTVDGEPRQRVAPVEESGFPLLEHDLGESAEAEAQAEFGRLTDEEAYAPFNLERGPLVRGRLVRLGARDHVLLMTLDPLVSDARSIGVFVHDLGVLYAAFLGGQADPLPALLVQYADYAAWQRQLVSGGRLREQAEYWTEVLAGAPEPLELPTDRPRSVQPAHAGAFVGLELDEEVTAGLRALGGRHGATLSTTLLAGWAALLGRLSGQTDLVIGTSGANRGRGEVEGLIGHFENTLPVRVDLSDSPSTVELLGRVKARVLGALRNQDIPFQRVVELARPAGATSPAAPLFQTAFAWRDASASGPELPNLELGAEAAPQPRAMAGLHLSLALREEGGRIVGEVQYAPALFDRETAERYAVYARQILAGMAADETRPVDRLPLLSEGERRCVVDEWNRTDAPYPGQSCLHERFEAQAARTPDVVAVVFEERQLTYGELNRRANRLAHHLRDLGVGPDARVGICVQRGLEMVVGLLGVLKAGGAYLPLDPGYPKERLVDMARDSAPMVVLTHGTLAGRLAGLDLPLVALDEDAAWGGGQPDTNPERGELTPEHLAYVIYTSGSTGRPKGVQLVHRGVSNLVHWYMGATRISERDSVLIATSFSFHLTQRNLLAPLFAGGRLHLAPEPFEPRAITARIAASAISMMNITPTAFEALVETDQGKTIGGMRIVVFGGEPLYPRQLARVPEPRPEFLNVYGATEATGIATFHFARAELASYPSRSMPPGRPIANIRVYVLDGAGEPVPVGVTGELYIGGVGVARGYRRRPAQTAERFLPDPLGGEPGARLYRTGDLGRWLPDGMLESMGRNDAQVKVRGFRVELEEIEARLAEHTDVREAVVVARSEGTGEVQLAAYYVGGGAGAEALRAHLAERLPEYMVPAAYVRLPTLPLTANGKLDRRALPAPRGDAYARRGYEAPAGGTEAALAEIWSELLGVDRVGVHDSFFELGGHSLSAVRMLSRVRQVLDVDVHLVELFQRPVLADFARGVDGAARAELSAIEPVERGEHLPLSFPQQRLWFLEQLGGVGAAYHMGRRLRLRGALDQSALRRALDRIVARHEALRTTFRTVDGEPEQHITPADAAGFPLEHDLGALPAAEGEGALARLIAEEVGAPFDLAEGPLVRGRLVRLGEEDHVLLVTMHHMVSDGWSVDVFVQELGTLYGAFRRGDADPLAPLPVQYADYAAWQRRLVSGELLRTQAEYWTRALAGAPELLTLPADHARPLQQDHGGDRVPLALDEAFTAELQALAGRHGATLFMTVLAAWAATLGRLSGQAEVVIGAPTANRGRREIEGLIGFFVNTLALRVDLSGAPTAAELLERVRVRSLEAQQNQDIPFEQVVERVQPVRSLAHSPLFQVMLSWQSTPPVRPELPGLSLHSLGGEPDGTAKFDLTLTLAEAGGRITGNLTYATALFERGTVERHLVYLRRVLEGMVAGEQRPVNRLSLLSMEERRQVMEEWNATAASFSGGSCIHHLFEAQVGRTPDAVAVVHRSESLTYAELNARANRLAHHLRARGVGPDARVAVCVERGLEMMVGLLGVLKAGGAYVPLDPAYPVERLRYMLESSAPAALLTQAGLDGVPVPHGVPVLDLSAPAPAWADGPAANPDPHRVGLTPGHLAYVIYTSGSTGQPKGVMVGHGGVVNLLWSMRDAVGMVPGDRFLAVTTIAFDIAALELFLPLACGARTVILDRADAADPVLLAAAIAREEATVLQATPATWRMLVEGGWTGRAGLRALCGGEALDAVLAAQVRARVGALWNVYGPTETTIWSSAEARAGEAGPGGRPHVPIGRPLANTQVYVLDGGGEPVPVGVAGELYIGGAGVTRGYRGRPGQTADRFVPDPFGAEPGARLYRTGDLGRWLPDGALAFMGRNDAQVKVRGFRVELGEIEARLAEHPDVREAVAVVRGDGPGGDRLVAYYAGGDAGAEALRAHLAERLPEYMLPAAYVRLHALPLTANGKLDRRDLPAPGGDAYARRGYEPPVGGTETALAEIWSELLGVDRVGVHDHFFELGGHSLLAMRVISRVRQVFGVELPPQTLFVASTVAGMAGRVDELRRAGLPVLPPVTPVPRTGPATLSFAQERLWFLDQLQPGSAFYNVPSALRLRGALDAEALERALGEIVRRHEALRTTFGERDGTPVQVVAPFAGFGLPAQDLSGLEGVEREAEVRRLASRDAVRPFDLSAGPLVRAGLLRLASDEHVLLVCMHHVVSDGWSLGVLFRELWMLYGAYRDGQASLLPALPVQYADYAAWQREHLRDEALAGQVAYWRERLAGSPALLELPTDHPRPAEQTYRGGSVAAEIPGELVARLRAVGRREGATLYMVMLGAFQVLLGKYAGTEDVVVGSPIAGRTRREVEDLIGFFVNTLVLRTDLSGDPAFGEVLRRVRETALGAYAHQDLPFERLVAELQPERSLSHSPLFQVLFTLGDAVGTRADVPGLRMERVEGEAETTQFDLHLAILEGPGGFRAVLRYATDLFERGTVVRMLAHLRQLLEQVSGDDSPRLSRLEVMGAAERRRLLEGWNETAADYPADRCTHELFEAQAARTPGAVALVYGHSALTYGELNARANRLAHRLRERGVTPDARVAICAERGVEMVVGLLAILKAGGAYVPLDPAYPADRLCTMLEDSDPLVLLAYGVPRERFAGSGVAVMDLAAEAPSWADHPAENPDRAGLTPDHLCYVIYTSGSTGRPKGVTMPHRPLVNLVAWQEPDAGPPRAAVTLQFTSISFDVSFQEIFTTLHSGGRLVIASEEARHDPAAILDLVEREGVERLSLPFTMLQLVAEQAIERGLPPLPLREVQTAGEALRISEPIRRWLSALRVPLHNHYGPSETHVATSFSLEGATDKWPLLPPIGSPVANTRVYVLDGHRSPVPEGVRGELYLGGVCVARGYLDRRGLTAERFVPDPFAPERGARMYRTGDRVRWLPDGTLDFLGRLDHQVKIRGFRIEPGEIEAGLRRHPAVSECVVVVREDTPGERRLVAYVAGEAETGGLREHLRGSLPEYMVPTAFVRMDSLPLTPNGKLNRGALPAPEYVPAAERYVAPRTPVEETLAEIWAEVLRLERVGVHDNFFDLGGHSLRATRVVSRIRRALGSGLTVRAIFEAPTVEGLARLVAEAASTDPAGRAGEPPKSAASNPDHLLSRLDELSDDELDLLLSAQS